MISSIFILGGHIQALGLARQVKSMGLKVYTAINDNCAVVRFSNCVDDVYFYNNDTQLLDILISHGDKTSLLFPTSDELIVFLVQHRERLSQLYEIALPSNSVIELFANKRNTCKFAVENNIPHPKTLCPNSVEELRSFAKEFSFPCVLKPSIMHAFHKQFGKKAFLCESIDELLAKVDSVVSSGFPIENLMVQEFISGGPKNLYSYGCFAKDGKPVVSIQANRIRQNPMDFGNSTTFAIATHIERIEELARSILSQTHYTGMAEIEFMFHNGEYKFLEINTRAWKWHTISNGRNYSFVGAWIKCLNGESPLLEIKSNRIAWVERLTDLVVCTKEILKGKMSFSDVIQSYHQNKVSAVWSWSDPLPALMYVLLSPILFIKRY